MAPHCEQAFSPFPIEPHRVQTRAGVNSIDEMSSCGLCPSAAASRGKEFTHRALSVLSGTILRWTVEKCRHRRSHYSEGSMDPRVRLALLAAYGLPFDCLRAGLDGLFEQSLNRRCRGRIHAKSIVQMIMVVMSVVGVPGCAGLFQRFPPGEKSIQKRSPMPRDIHDLGGAWEYEGKMGSYRAF